MTRFRSCFSLFLIAASLAVSACSLTVESDRVQCKSDKDCAARGHPMSTGSAPKKSASLIQPGPASAKRANRIGSETVRVTFKTVDLKTQTLLTGVRLTLCAKMDANCQGPIATYQSNPEGNIEVDMPKGFDGYFQTEGDGLYPMLFFPPSTRQQLPSSKLPIVTTNFVGMMFSGVGGPIKADRTRSVSDGFELLGQSGKGFNSIGRPIR